jgi:hypothetical protein
LETNFFPVVKWSVLGWQSILKKKLREKKLRFNNFRIKIYNYSRKRQGKKKIARARGPCRPHLPAIPDCFVRQLI